jgi:TonB family protein
MKTCLLVLILLFLTQPNLAVASDKAREEGNDLLKEAAQKADIFELPSFQMKAELTIDNRGRPLRGFYAFLWDGPDSWREEINLPGYSEVLVGGRGVVSTKRTTDFMPLPIHWLGLTMNYGRRIALHPDETVKKVHDKTIDGQKVKCVIVALHESSREVCIDPPTGALVRESPFSDKDVLPVGTKLFPNYLSYIENGSRLVEVRITELSSNPQFPPSVFDPPPGAVTKPSCWNPSVGHLIKHVSPEYPAVERQLRAQGTVWIYTVIGTDGVPHDPRVLSGVTAILNKASLDAVRQWRYEPYACEGTPVEVESVISVNFALSH